MKNIIIILVLALGAVSCDKGEYVVTNNPDAIESFIITNGAERITVMELMCSDFSEYHYNGSVLTIDYFNSKKYTFIIDSDYGCPIVGDCKINNQLVDYSEFKNLLLISFFDAN